MKKLVLSLAAIAALCMVSCEGNANKTENENDSTTVITDSTATDSVVLVADTLAENK